MEAEVKGLREVLEVERKRAEELCQERDRWSAAAEAFQQQLVEVTKKPKEFLGWLRRS
jgi:hypothetical protein